MLDLASRVYQIHIIIALQHILLYLIFKHYIGINMLHYMHVSEINWRAVNILILR